MGLADDTTRGSASPTLEESDQITNRIERALIRLAVIARVVGWVWMLMLVVVTLTVNSDVDKVIVIGSMVLATAWTGVSVWAARDRFVFGSAWFVWTDAVVVLLVGAASWAAGAENLFHGGYLIPTLLVASYGLGLGGVTLIATLIGLEQVFILFLMGDGPVSALSSLGFIIWGIIFGWLFSTIRRTDAYRRATVDDLMAERERSIRRGERLELANKLHDSALQTLQVIDTDAGDSERVRRLARRQTRELRNLVDAYASPEEVSLKTALVKAASDIEDLFDVDVSAVIRADVDMDPTLAALVEAAREAMTNAAKYSGTERIDLYSAIEDGVVAIYVRDEGRGFEPEHAQQGHGLENSVRRRVEDAGGEVCIESTPGEGTEIKVSAVPVGALR
ncbi:MAG: ATP-binding protein [Actinomycetota bacterium]